jgi:hypothetical protein
MSGAYAALIISAALLIVAAGAILSALLYVKRGTGSRKLSVS